MDKICLVSPRPPLDEILGERFAMWLDTDRWKFYLTILKENDILDDESFEKAMYLVDKYRTDKQKEFEQRIERELQLLYKK